MKKLLSILLTVVMVASVFVVPAGAFVPNREVTYTAGAVYLNQDFSDVSKTDFLTGYTADGIANAVEVIDEKAVHTPNPQNNALAFVSDANVGNATSYTVEFDVSTNIDVPVFVKDGGGYGIYIGTTKGSKPWVVELYPSGLKANTVRTYKFTVDLTFDSVAEDTMNGFCSLAQKKDAGESGFSDMEHFGAYYPKTEGKAHYRAFDTALTSSGFNQFTLSSDNQFTLGAREHTSNPFSSDLVITFDNIKIYKDGGASIGSNYETKVGVQYANDCEGNGIGRNESWSSSYKLTQGMEVSGNKYFTLIPTAEGGYTHVAVDSINGFLEKDKILTFDVRCETEDAATFAILQYNNNSSSDQSGKKLTAKLHNFTVGQWYTYKFDTKDGIATTEVKVYRKLRDQADSEYKLLTLGTDYTDGAGLSDKEAIYFRLMDKKASHVDKPQYSIDNIQIRDRVAYSGNLSNSEATLFVETDEASETVIMASYDGSVLKDVDFETLDGADNKAELSVTAGTANTQIFVWNNLLGGKPILTSPIEIAQ